MLYLNCTKQGSHQRSTHTDMQYQLYLCSTSCKLLACNVTTEGCGFGSPCALSSYAAQVHGLSSMTIVLGSVSRSSVSFGNTFRVGTLFKGMAGKT